MYQNLLHIDNLTTYTTVHALRINILNILENYTCIALYNVSIILNRYRPICIKIYITDCVTNHMQYMCILCNIQDEQKGSYKCSQCLKCEYNIISYMYKLYI